MNLKIYQTLEDRDNPDEVEQNGPFETKNNTAWLGYGSYFWDTHIDLAHWWGEIARENNYIIAKADAILDETCWDLHGNGLHRIEFEEICNEIVNTEISSWDRLLVAQVIEFLKRKGEFKYFAIRALATNSISLRFRDDYIIFRMHFRRGNHAFLDLRPPVQICLLKKRALSLQNYKVVFPEKYREEYA